MRHRHRFALAGAFAAQLAPGLALAQVATSAPPGIFDSIVGEVQAASSHWISIGAGKTGIGWHIFTGLATLELVWWGVTNALRKNDLGEWFSSLFLKMLELSFFGFIVSTAPTWMPAVIDAVRNVGAAFLYATPGAASIPSAEMTPSGIMTLANTLVEGLPHLVADSSSWTHLAQSFLASLALVVSTVLLYVGFALVALQLLMTLIEMYMVLGIGSIMLGFLGSRWTVQFGERYISYAVSVGAKLITSYAIVGIMVSLASKDATWMHQAGAGSVGPTNLIELASNGLIGGVLALAIPSVAGSALGGGAALGLSHLTSAGGGIARAGAAAGLGAAAGGVAAKAALGRLAALTGVSGSPAGGIGGAGSSVGGFKGGAGAIASTPPPPGGATGTRGAGGAAGAGMGAAGKAAGAGVSAAGKAAGAAISAVPGLQPVGAAVSAAGQAAGKGVEAAGKAAGKGVEAAGKAVSAARGAAGAATTGSGAGPAGGTSFGGGGKGAGGAASTGSAPGTGGPDQLSAPSSAGGSPTGGGGAQAGGDKGGQSAAGKLWQQAQHHAGQAHRGLPHEGGVSAPGLRFSHSED